MYVVCSILVCVPVYGIVRYIRVRVNVVCRLVY